MLETEIKRLNDNIERLNAMLERMEAASERNAETVKAMSQPAQQPAQQPTQKPAQSDVADTPAVENEQTPTGYTTDDIKSMALAISRKDRSKQKDIKAKLSDHGAKVATDLSGDALQAVGEWLSALKEELGA
jgi:hypothetical protein